MLQSTASPDAPGVCPDRRAPPLPRPAPAAIVVELGDAMAFAALADRLAARSRRECRGLCVLQLWVRVMPGAGAPADAMLMQQVLAECARRLRSRIRATDTIARWGGTQFGVLLPGCAVTHAAAVMTRLSACASGPYRLGDQLIGLTVQGELQRCL